MRRIIGRLKGRQVANARPDNGRRSSALCDGGGLYLELSAAPEGHVRRSWTFRYEIAGHRHELGLGSTNAIGLAKARQKARALREQLADGLDPLTEKRRARQQLLADKAKTITFEEVTMMYYRLHADGWGTVHRDQWLSSMKRYAFPALGKLAPTAIDSAAVLKVIEPLWQTKTVTASRVLNRIEAIFEYCKTSGLRAGDNPAGGIRTALPKQSRIATVEPRCWRTDGGADQEHCLGGNRPAVFDSDGRQNRRSAPRSVARARSGSTSVGNSGRADEGSAGAPRPAVRRRHGHPSRAAALRD